MVSQSRFYIGYFWSFQFVSDRFSLDDFRSYQVILRFLKMFKVILGRFISFQIVLGRFSLFLALLSIRFIFALETAFYASTSDFYILTFTKTFKGQCVIFRLTYYIDANIFSQFFLWKRQSLPIYKCIKSSRNIL